LFRNDPELQIVKKAAVLTAITAIVIMIFADNRWTASCGLIAGSVLSILRYWGLAFVMDRVVCNSSSSQRQSIMASILIFVANQLILFVLLLIFNSVSSSLFWGFVYGILMVPAAVMINCVAKTISIFKNGLI